MSPIAIVSIVVGGTLLFAGAMIAFFVWHRRSYNAEQNAAMTRLREQAPQHGWTFEERNDGYVEVYNNQQAHTPRRQLAQDPPKARSAHDVVTGTHRGRPFLAAKFKVYQAADARHEGRFLETAPILVRTPSVRPMVSVRRAVAMQSAVNAGLGLTMRTGHQEFDKKFEVDTEDERFAQAVLHPGMIEFLLNDPRPLRGFWLLGGHLDVVHEVGDHRDPQNLIPALDLRCDILDLIPQQVWA